MMEVPTTSEDHMLVVEGPDGSGKTTLAERLSEELDWPIAGKVVDSQMKAMTDLKKWTEENLAAGWQDTIFDRHRLLSEPIYGALRTSSERSELYDPLWQSRMYKLLVDAEPLIIYCLPPLEEVLNNLDGDENNKVVFAHADAIYRGYVAQYSLLNAMDFPVYLFDYTQDLTDSVVQWVDNEVEND